VASLEVGLGATISTLQTGYPYIQASSQDREQGMLPCAATCLVDDEVQHRGVVKKQTMVESALDVSKDVLRGREMGLTMVVHVEAHLLHRVGNVEPSEGDVLESPS
jgi:hypothetical protein